jgi:nifR3 family TIM-barrel protein
VKIPVTVKTRLGWDERTLNVTEVAERLQDIGIKALTVHGRTRKQMYKGAADWTLIGEIKNNPRITIPLFGNGDVDSPQKAKLMRDRYGVDGVMIGRASIGNPWIFNQIKNYLNGKLIKYPTIEERVEVCRIHLQKSIEWKGNTLGILEMRRHYANYFKGIDHFKEYRMRLVTLSVLVDIMQVLDEIEEKYSLTEAA